MSPLLGLVKYVIGRKHAGRESWHDNVKGIVLGWMGVWQVLEGGQGHLILRLLQNPPQLLALVEDPLQVVTQLASAWCRLSACLQCK